MPDPVTPAAAPPAAGMRPVHQEALKSLARLLAIGGLAGGSARLGYSVLRNTSPRYEAPTVGEPVVVDMPYEAPGPVGGPIPVPRKTRPLDKAAGFFDETVIGRGLRDIAPQWTPPEGRPDAAAPVEVPLYWAGAALAAPAGLAAGFSGMDKVLRAADRWRARRDLDGARREYQDAVLARMREARFPKAAADFAAVADGREPADPDLRRAAAALDRAYAALTKAADGPAPTDADYLSRILASIGMPGLALGPRAAGANMAIAGGAAGLGAYGGYTYFRDKDRAEKVRKDIKAVDRANAEEISPPIIARLFPVYRG